MEDFDPGNPGWNGLSRLSSELHLQRLPNLIDRDLLLRNPSNATLLILGPDWEFTESEAMLIREFLESGGVAILADDFEYGNSLLQLLHVDAYFNNSLLVDPLFMEIRARLPRIRSFSNTLNSLGISGITLNYATIIEGCKRPLALSSYYSFLDLNLDNKWDEGEPKGPFTVACEVEMGRGRLFLISDPSMP